MAAVFYVEPFDTIDIDIFFEVRSATGGLDILAPLYKFLSGKGYHPREEFVEIEGWPVQFLPAFNPLIEQAVREAQSISFKRVPARVFSAEHLVAIALETGRPKDYARIASFIEQGVLDETRLGEILGRHGLNKKWKTFVAR